MMRDLPIRATAARPAAACGIWIRHRLLGDQRTKAWIDYYCAVLVGKDSTRLPGLIKKYTCPVPPLSKQHTGNLCDGMYGVLVC